MSDAISLVAAILDDPDRQAAGAALEAALNAEVDPLLYCCLVHGIDEVTAMQRAAHWAGYAFFDRLPAALAGYVAPNRLEALAGVRVFTLRVLDRDVAFAAPDFFGLLRLARALPGQPHLRQRLCLLPAPALRSYLADAAAEALVTDARQGLARRWPYACAQLELTAFARYGFALALLLLAAMVLVAPFAAELVLLPIALALLVAPAAIRLGAVGTAPRPVPRPQRPPDETLPVYSVLIPLRNEAAMVPQLFAGMRALDYPPASLDIKFVVESASTETLAAVAAQLGDPRFSLVAVPDAPPRTKPKALDYALPLCRGEYVVVFDAEDQPDPDQLWQAALRFRDTPDLVCLQASLVIDNGHHNLLAALFAGEYAGLFAVLLPALARWRLPMPLGGTSNHFRLAALRQLGGWDAYNVTEDADLGMRLARRRLRVETLGAGTSEHAPERLRPWLGQRTRWMKGWMQTFIVHNRAPFRLVREMGLGPALAFEALVLGMILAPLLHCGLIVGLVWHILHGLPLLQPGGWPVFYLGVLALGYASALAQTVLGLWRTRRLMLLPAQVLLPAYWLLMSLATLCALVDLLRRPFYWFKSPHRPVAPAPPAQ